MGCTSIYNSELLGIEAGLLLSWKKKFGKVFLNVLVGDNPLILRNISQAFRTIYHGTCKWIINTHKSVVLTFPNVTVLLKLELKNKIL